MKTTTSKSLVLKCKEPGCPCIIRFSSQVNIPGNQFIGIEEDYQNSLLKISISNHDSDIPLPISLGISQEKDHSRMNFIIDKRTSTEKFYLTCDKGHTYPYDIYIDRK